MTAREIYEFAGFTLDVGERRLVHGDRIVGLAPKAHDLLVALVRHAGRLVTKQELLDLVWPDAHVEEGILSVHVSNLRRELDDRDSNHQVIETVARTGYRFIAGVRRRAAHQDTYSMRWPIGVLAAQPAVYELVGRGRAHLLTSSMPEIPKAVEAFRSAIALERISTATRFGSIRITRRRMRAWRGPVAPRPSCASSRMPTRTARPARRRFGRWRWTTTVRTRRWRWAR